MTHVLIIQELYKLIPETAVLEKTNFSTLKELITAVVEKIESSGKWEFVQYVSGNPSLFIIREKEEIKLSEKVVEVSEKTPIPMPKQIKNDYNTNPEDKKWIKETKSNHDAVVTPIEEKLFQETKLPW
jgi:hypothetical protein